MRSLASRKRISALSPRTAATSPSSARRSIAHAPGKLFRIPEESTTDGASTPVALWLEIPPFGTYWRAAALHDAAYRNTLQIQNASATGWQPANLSKQEADDLLNEAMILDNVPELKRVAIYEGVKLGGTTAFDQDRAAKAA